MRLTLTITVAIRSSIDITMGHVRRYVAVPTSYECAKRSRDYNVRGVDLRLGLVGAKFWSKLHFWKSPQDKNCGSMQLWSNVGTRIYRVGSPNIPFSINIVWCMYYSKWTVMSKNIIILLVLILDVWNVCPWIASCRSRRSE